MQIESVKATSMWKYDAENKALQWNLFITTTSKIKCITFDLFSDVF